MMLLMTITMISYPTKDYRCEESECGYNNDDFDTATNLHSNAVGWMDGASLSFAHTGYDHQCHIVF